MSSEPTQPIRPPSQPQPDPEMQQSPPTRLEPQLQQSPETRQEPQCSRVRRPGRTRSGSQARRPGRSRSGNRRRNHSRTRSGSRLRNRPLRGSSPPQWQQDRPPAPRWQQDQGGYQGGYQDAPPPPQPRRRHRVRHSVIALFIILVLALLLVIANFVGKAIAENDMANQFTANGFPVKPSVNIEGFPFLTQVAAKDFRKVVITASNVPAGPVTIASLNATIIGMHLNSSWNGATIDQLTATAFIPLGSLTGGISSELGDAASLTAVPDGTDRLKVTGTVLGASASGVVEIKQTGPQQITVELPTVGGLVGSLLGSSASFPINLPAGVPPSLRITGLTLNGSGLTLSAAATNATFSK